MTDCISSLQTLLNTSKDDILLQAGWAAGGRPGGPWAASGKEQPEAKETEAAEQVVAL